MSATADTRLGDVSFAKASAIYRPQFDAEAYAERTARNQYWIGGAKGQEQIRALSVGVAGLGGMGSNIAEQLIRLGIGHVRIADPDHIEATNLNRQVIANRSTLGKAKVAAAVEDLRGIAEDFELVAYRQGITAEMVDEFVSDCDAVVDEIDIYELQAHVLLHRAARAHGIPLYSAYAVGFGVHFYKFHGDSYTFEDFMGGRPEDWDKPTAEFLIERIGRPYPFYLTPPRLSQLAKEISGGATPIFGPTTLIGHSIVTIRMVLDLLETAGKIHPDSLKLRTSTPTMPEFLVLDLGEMSFKVAQAL